MPGRVELKNRLFRENQRRVRGWTGRDVRQTSMREVIAPYVKPLPAESDELIVLASHAVGSGGGSSAASRMYIPIVTRGMVRTYQRCVESMLEIGIDGKCKVIRGGWRIFSVGVLVRSAEPVPTTLSRAGGHRQQGVAYTLQFRPLAQIVMSSESEVNVQACLEDLGNFLDSVAPKHGFPKFAERIRQVHKDHALALETARRSVLPGSRTVDDFPHFDRHGQKEIPARCTATHVEESSGKTVKTHASLIVAFYHEARTAVSLDLFSALWRGMFSRITYEFGENAASEYLRRAYFMEIEASSLEAEVGVAPTAHVATPYLWSGHWRGALGLRPGTGSGNQATEAFHSPFQQEIASAGGPCNPGAALPFLQGFYSRWRSTLQWDSDVALSSLPHTTDITMLTGSGLHKHGRSPASEYFDGRLLPNHHVFPRGLTTYVAIANRRNPRGGGEGRTLPGSQRLDIGIAAAAVEMVELGGSELAAAMLRHGVLTESTGDVHPWTSVASMRKHFVDVAIVVEGERALVATGRQRVCSCEVYSLRAECEHTLLVEGLELPGRPPVRDFARMVMPGEKKRGRPRGTVAEQRAKRGSR